MVRSLKEGAFLGETNAGFMRMGCLSDLDLGVFLPHHVISPCHIYSHHDALSHCDGAEEALT